MRAVSGEGNNEVVRSGGNVNGTAMFEAVWRISEAADEDGRVL